MHDVAVFGCRRRGEAVSALLGAHRQDGRRLVQSHDVRRLWRRVLLALHEGDIRPALSQVCVTDVLAPVTFMSSCDQCSARVY